MSPTLTEREAAWSAFTEAARRFLTLLEVPTLDRLPDDPRYPGGVRFKITANARRLRSAP